MTGPAIYEASVPFLRKALQNQVKMLSTAKEWCKENQHDESALTKATLVTDMFVRTPVSKLVCTFLLLINDNYRLCLFMCSFAPTMPSSCSSTWAL